MLNNIAALLGTGVAASASSYESIATATGTGLSGTISFTSIPSTYKHLQIRLLSRTTQAADYSPFNVRFNSDTGANYTYHFLKGNGSTASAGGGASNTSFYIDDSAGANNNTNIMGANIFDILDYASTSKYKTLRSINGMDNNSLGRINLSSGVWMSTSAVTQIDIYISSGSWATNNTFALYGIKG